MNSIYVTDIRDKKEFTFQGDRLEQYKSYGDGWWLYKRYNHYSDFHFMGWELVKSVRHKNPDGEIVYTYPSSEQFGTYGLFLPQRYTEKDCDLAHIKKVEEDSKKSIQTKKQKNIPPPPNLILCKIENKAIFRPVQRFL